MARNLNRARAMSTERFAGVRLKPAKRISAMRKVCQHASLAIVTLLASSLAFAQNAARPQADKPGAASALPDLSGVWTQYPRISARSGVLGGFVFTQEEPPMTPWAEAKYKAAKAAHVGGYEGESDDTTLTCAPPGVPRIYLFNFPMEIMQIPGRVILFYEFGHFVRQVFTDGRGHAKDAAPTWMGDSIGKWEADTLVIDTVGFNDKTWIDQVGHPHSDALHLVERIRRSAPDMLQIDITFDDPKAYSKSWTARKTFKLRPDWNIAEYICEDNFFNKDIQEISK
jgi:hypothetical protein